MSQVKPYKDLETGKKEQVEAMFDRVSSRYDLLNRILSGGIDISWRKKVVKLVLDHQPTNVLDIATGTGDLAIALAKEDKQLKVTGLDLSKGMLSKADEKVKAQNLTSQIDLIQGDAENLPFEDASFDVVTVAFGVRNFEDLNAGLLEINRVLRPGGKLVILEFSQPEKFPIKQAYSIYSTHVLPRIGRLISADDRAYDYLPNSIQSFAYGQEMMNILKSCNFGEPYYRTLLFGIASIYVGLK